LSQILHQLNKGSDNHAIICHISAKKLTSLVTTKE